jgi:three-Cys-motif partner protein
MDGGRKDNGNWDGCTDEAGLPLQDVGSWALRKHELLKKFIEASAGPRSRFLRPPKPGVTPGGACYIELFAGPGRARVRDTGELIPGSPLIALGHEKQPFTKVALVELDEENVGALRARTQRYGDRVEVIQGDCNEVIDDVLHRVPPHGLNLALIDPYGLAALRFSTIEKLARFARMDLIIHFPVGDMKRNFKKDKRYADWIERALGARVDVTRLSDLSRAIEVLRQQLERFGYEQEQVRSLPICNNNNVPLYHLVYLSKSKKGSEIWTSLVRNDGAQRGWNF